MMHTAIFVNDMQESIAFYTEKLGLKLLGGPNRIPDFADMAFVGRDWQSYIELLYDLREHEPYVRGNRYEHIAMDVFEGVPETIERLRSAGVKVVGEPMIPRGGTRCIAFIEDPNGVRIELLEPRER